jgi:hypothetical protein
MITLMDGFDRSRRVMASEVYCYERQALVTEYAIANLTYLNTFIQSYRIDWVYCW